MTRNSTIKLFSLTTLFAAMVPAMQANAAGFQVFEHSAAGLGRAFAGEAAIADDASVVARNVAGMAFLDKPVFTAAGSYIKPDVKVESSSHNLVTQEKKNSSDSVADDAVVPAFYFAAPINEKVSFGAGVFSNYAFTTNYEKSSAAAPSATHSDIKSLNFNTSLAYKLQDNLSVGFGLNAVYVEGKLENYAASDVYMPTQHGLVNLGKGDILSVSGDDWGFGWNTGVLWEPVKGTRIGASYRSEVKATLEGKAKSDLLAQFNDKGSIDLDMPAIAELSIYQDVTDQLSVHASYVRTYWSSFKEIVVKLDNGQGPAADPKDYRDSSRWAVGTTYKMNDAWTLRAGYAYDNSPVSNKRRDFRIPDSDRQWYTMGASYQMGKNQSIDMGYALMKSHKVEIHSEALNGAVDVDGKVKAGTVHIFSVQYNYVF